MKTRNKLFILSILLATGWNKTHAQNSFPTGVGTSVGIGTSTPASRFQVIGGESRFGAATNYGQFAADGDLTFTGNGDYLVGGNRYAFRFSGDQDYGLFFNQTSLRYEFRDATATPVFYATTAGDGFFTKGVQIGNSAINTAGNIRWNGTDFEGYNGTVWKSFTVTGGGAETDPQVGANTANYVPKWDGSALVTSTIFDDATNVGIGTSTPTQKLDVAGNIKASGTMNASGGNSGNWNSAFGWGNHATAGYITSESDPQVGTNTTNYLSKWNGTSLVTSNVFDNATNVGIGTASPTEKLDVAGNIKASGTMAATGGNSTNWNSAFGWGNHAIAGYITSESDPQVGTNTTNYLPKWNGSSLGTGTIYDNGNVGIGTSTPSSKLSVSAVGLNLTSPGSFQLGETNAFNIVADDDDIQARNNGISGKLYLQYYGGDLSLCSGAGKTTFGGNVGIGNSTPAEKLDVAGNIKASGTITATGGSSTNWNSAFGWGNHATAGYISSESDPQVGTNTTNYLPKWNGSSLATGTIYDNGNVGVGTITPSSKLSILGTILFGLGGTGSLQIGESNNPNIVADNNELQARDNGAGSKLNLQSWGGDLGICSGGGSTIFGGKVGIGVTPDLTLDIGGRMRLQSDANSAGVWFMNQANTINKAFVGMVNDNTIGMYGSSGAGWALNMNCNSGYVGIGTTAPLYPLEVTGNDVASIKVTSSYNVGNIVEINGLSNTGNTWGIYSGVPTTGYAGFFSGNIYCSGSYLPSDERLKQNIKPLEKALDKVMKLETKTYTFKKEGLEKMCLPEGNQFGFISQNMETIFPELVRLNPAKGEYNPVEFKAINYVGMIPILTEAIQELKGELTSKDASLKAELEAKDLAIAELKKVMDTKDAAIRKELEAKDVSINELKTAMRNMEDAIATCCTNTNTNAGPNDADFINTGISTEKAILEQNAPNPFREKTTINYYIPSDVKNAMVQIYSLNGDAIKTIKVNGTGRGSVEVNGGSFSAGTYTYQLILDGKTIDTKLMVITK